MAAMIKLAAATAVNKGPSSSYYSNDKANPVLQSLDQELNLYIGYMKKRVAKGYRKPNDESASRASDTLFELWNKFEPRLPQIYYQRKLLEIGDFLVSIKEYHLALWQCYGRYLKHFGDVNVEEIVDITQFKQVFFPSGFNSEDAGFTFRALMGRSICAYQVIKQSDPQLQNQQSVTECVQLLAFLRLVMQVILPNEPLCWLVYNGTVHIYSISRHLMSLGHSSKVLEFVLWACMCMESSVPLLAVRYLTWRATLYTAVCQCYYDCKAGHHAESFARRALTKINELSQLEAMSNTPESRETECLFRNATVKMAIMVYRRTVFETRRKPKGLLRPKTRANLKDAAQLPWPRTQSEKLLHEMFEGGASQTLCLLETLNDTNRRTLLSSPPAADSDVELLDVYAELFMAAQEIIAGGGGTQGNAPAVNAADIKVPGMAGVVRDSSLIQMAMQGEDGVPMTAVVRIVKLAYCYEQWDVFDSMLDNTISAIREMNEPSYGADEKVLEIIKAYDKVTPRTRHRRLFVNDDDSEINQDPGLPPPPSQSKMSASGQDDVIQLAEVLLSVVTGPYTQEELDLDIVVDACLCLWTKCKAVFQKYQTGSTDNPKYLLRMESPSKWVYVLDIVHQVLCWCGLAAVDPALTAEVALRLALVFEASAALESSNKYKSGKSPLLHDPGSRSKDIDEEHSIASTSFKDMASSRQGSHVTSSEYFPDFGGTGSRMTAVSESPLFGRGMRAQLLQARDILEVGLANVSYARHVVALSDGKDIADVGWAKDLNEDLFKPLTNESEAPVVPADNLTTVEEEKTGDDDHPAEAPAQETVESTQSGATAVWNMIRDLHLELIFMYHRICLKLAGSATETSVKASKSFKRRTCSNLHYGSSQDLASAYIEKEDELVSNCHSNGLSKALLYMQRALVAGSVNSDAPNDKQKELLNEAKAMILRTQTEERRLFCENTMKLDETVATTKTKVPPAPILLCRTDTSAIFRPAPFYPSSNAKVAWYRSFARTASGANVKVRLNDYYLPGTGEEVPAFHCELRVTGLTAGEKYVFAVAAYTSDGQLIGGSIGESSRPILASHPLPILLTWAYLCQVGYQVGYLEVTCEACDVLWSHFVAEPPPPQQVTYTTSAQNDFKLTLHRLNQRVVVLVSPILLRMFLSSIFIKVDISIRDAALFCDLLCAKGPLTKRQLSRLTQCEQMLVGLELAGWLNESSLALQAVVQCYGVLAPMIYFKIPAIPVIQVLERCHAILQEIPVNMRTRRQSSINESLHHMTACLTYHLAKVLRSWSQRSLASNINDNGRKMLSAEIDRDKEVRLEQIRAIDQNKIPATEKQAVAPSLAPPGDEHDEQAPPAEHATETGSLTLAALKKKKTRKGGVISGKEESDGAGNEELKALEAHMLRLSKQAQGEHELSGNEDPSILHAYIAYLPSKMAHKEVVKFKRRARYLEFFVQVASKAVAEGLAEQALEWCEDAITWLSKRNEQILGSKASVIKQPGVVTIAGDDPKKFAAALVEYAKDKEKASQGTKSKGGGGAQSKATGAVAGAPVKPVKKPRYKAINIHPGMSDAQRQAQEEAELKALQTLSMHLVEMVHSNNRRKRFRKICTDEMPWRAHLNIVQGLSQFGVFLHRLEFREKMLGNLSNHTYKTSFLDQEWFTFETAGTLVVGWEGGPSRQVTRQESRAFHSMATGRASGIEMAAAAATGKPGAGGLLTIAQEDEDTPRTYRSETGPQRRTAARSDRRGNKAQEEDPESALISPAETCALLEKAFAHFRRAIVLAHRGQHWTLLQNACRALWNCTHTALLRTHSSDPDALLNVDSLRGLACQAFSMAADFLLDMLVHLQAFGTHTNKKKGSSIGVKVNSWTESIGEEKGGASLKFEAPLDDISMADMRWIRALILRVLEMLYYEQKWERLADIGLRFNALTDNRYVEQVNPLVVQAQRKITSRIQQYSGPAIPQPHFQLAAQESGGPITAKRYSTVQLHVHVKDDELSHIDPGAHIDPAGHDVYSEDDEEEEIPPGGIGALRLSCVPLDVDLTLLELREVLLRTPYTARALQHSRRLLVLYLAGQMNNQDELLASASRGASRVDFIPTTARPQPTMPLDLLHEEFLSMDDVQTTPLPHSQIGVVITSYDKTIEMLLANNQKGLAAQAMKELGNLYFHMGNLRLAYKWWSESLDKLLGRPDVIKTWQSIFKAEEDISSVLLAKCGLWGCILGAVIASNIAQYIQTSDLGARTECCFLSGYFFKALFRASLPHPTSDRDYALYDIGEGCEVTHLVPGIDLLSDRFRCDGRTLVSSLHFVNDELARGRHYLFALPLLSLYQYLTTFVCRDMFRCVEGRILKTRVLTELSLFSEAFVVLQRLLNGERLPHTADSNFRQMESRTTAARFDTSKPLLDPSNVKVLESVLDKRLSSNLGMLYGPHLTCHLSVTQAHLYIALSETIPTLPRFEDISPPGTTQYIQPHSISTMSRAGGRGIHHVSLPSSRASMVKPSNRSSVAEETGRDGGADDETGTVARAGKRFTDSKHPVTLEVVKGNLLSTADQILSTLAEIILENAALDKGIKALSAAELEMVVRCKLELAAIARQRHHAALAARIIIAAMQMLRDSVLFEEKEDEPRVRKTSALHREQKNPRDTPVRLTEPESSQFQFQNFQSLSRLDARLWLQCRLALIASMLGEVKGMGQVKGEEKMVKEELADIRQYGAEGVAEAEACGDIEMESELLLQGVVVDMMEGVHVNATKQLLEEVISRLSEVRQLSNHGQLLQSKAQIHMTDLIVSAEHSASPSQENVDRTLNDKAFKEYCNAQRSILDQLELFGEKIEHYYPVGGHPERSSPVSPLQNLYLPHLSLLMQTKLRIGQSMSRIAARKVKQGAEEAQAVWAEPLGVLMTGLHMSQVIAYRIASTEAELLLNIGKLQRQLVSLGQFQARIAVRTLLDAIKISYASNHDLGLMRQAYLEIALSYLCSIQPSPRLTPYISEDTMTSLTSIGSTLESEEEGQTPVPKDPKSKKKRPKVTAKDRKKSSTGPPEPEDSREQEKRAAWVAIRCATAVAQAQRSRLLLAGSPGVSTQEVSAKPQAELPEFAVLDLVSAYTFGEKKRIYKDEIEEELAPLTEALEPPGAETYDDMLNKARQAVDGLSWVQILGYQSILQRISSTATITTVKKKDVESDTEAGDLGPEFDLGFISHAQFNISLNHDSVRSVLFSPMWNLRLMHMHQFLINHLAQYASECIAIYPPSNIALPLPPDVVATSVPIISQNYLANRSVPPPEGSSIDMSTAPPGVWEVTQKPSDALIKNPTEAELCLQWYLPSLEDIPTPPSPENGEVPERKILLLFSVNAKKAQTPLAAHLWVSFAQLLDLHDRLVVLRQRGEISLVDKVKKEPSPPTTEKSVKGKRKEARIKALSPKVKRDELLEALLLQCMADVQKLFGIAPPEEKEVSAQEEGTTLPASTVLTGSVSTAAGQPTAGSTIAAAATPAATPAAGTAAATSAAAAPPEEQPKQPEIPFEVSKFNMHTFERLFDPTFGFSLQDAKMHAWFNQLFS